MAAQPALHPMDSRGQGVASPSTTSAEPPERQHFSHKCAWSRNLLGKDSLMSAIAVWSPELAPLRATYTTAVGSAIFLTVIVMWICL